MSDAICSTAGCGKPHRARGLCSTHYNQRARSGEAFEPRADRFWSRVDPVPSGCWLWTGPTRKGYGRAFVGGRGQSAHRVSYEQLVGPIPDGLVLDHLCRVRNCVNPEHLEPVTSLENLARGIGTNAQAIRDNRCQRGHEYTEANTRWRTGATRKPERVCKTCCREWKKEAGAKRTA